MTATAIKQKNPYIIPLLNKKMNSEEDLYGTLFSPHYVVNKALDIWEVSKDEFLGRSRKRDLVDRRAAVAMVLRYCFDRHLSTNTIGKVIGKDHSTIVHYSKAHRYFPSVNKLIQELLSAMQYIKIEKKEDDSFEILRVGKKVKIKDLNQKEKDKVIERLLFMQDYDVKKAIIKID